MTRRPGEEITEELPPPPPPVETAPAVPPVICRTCGEGNDPDRTFCRRCGSTLHETPPPPPPPVEEKPDRRPLIIGILATAAALVLIIVMVVALSGGDDPTVTPTTAVTTTDPPAATTTTAPPSTTTAAPPQDQVPLDTAEVTAVRVDTPPVLDGSLDEWADITSVRYLTTHAFFQAENWTGPDDLRAVWKLAWDADYLYIGVETFDDVHVQGESSRLWEGDSVDLEFDTDPGGDSEDGQVDLDDWQWILSPGNFDDVEPSFALLRGRGSEAFQGDSLNADLLELAATAKTPAGFILEARIPWRRMFVENPPAGTVFGFSLSASDNDTPGTADQETMISNDPAFRVAEPQTWGTLTLEP